MSKPYFVGGYGYTYFLIAEINRSHCAGAGTAYGQNRQQGYILYKPLSVSVGTLFSFGVLQSSSYSLYLYYTLEWNELRD